MKASCFLKCSLGLHTLRGALGHTSLNPGPSLVLHKVSFTPAFTPSLPPAAAASCRVAGSAVLPPTRLLCQGPGCAGVASPLLPAHRAVQESPKWPCWSPNLFWFALQLRIKLQIFLCRDRISPASPSLIRSQAVKVPDYLISPLQMYVTHPSHPESEPAWEKAAATQPSPALQASCKAERKRGKLPSQPPAWSGCCVLFLHKLPFSSPLSSHWCSSLQLLASGGGCGVADSCCWRDESPMRGFPAAPLCSLALLW